MKKVTIIVPVYNVEKYLPRCLDSLINQTLKELDIICVNDGSQDNSLAILQKYAAKDNRIKIIDKKNGGLSSARNEGLKYVSTPYVAFVDSDDYVEADTYQCALEAMERGNVDFVSWGADIVLENISESNPSVKAAEYYHTIRNIGYKELDDKTICSTPVTVWNKLFKVSIIQKYNIDFPNGLLYEDNEFFFKYVAFCKSAYYLNAYFYHYVQRQGSIMGTMFAKKNNKVFDYLPIYENIYLFYQKNNLLEKYSTLLSHKFNSILCTSYCHCYDKNLLKLKIGDLVNKLDNHILKNENIDFIKKKQFYRIVALRIPKYSLGNKILGVDIYCDKIKFKFLGGILSLKKSLIYSKQNEGRKKTVRILGLKFSTKTKVERLKEQLRILSNQLIQQQKEFEQKIENSFILSKEFLKEKLIFEAEKDNFKGNFPDFNDQIKQSINFDNFYFYPNVGNLGDGIIAAAEYQILNNGKYHYKIVDNYENRAFAPKEKYNLVYGGGGLFVKYWNYQKVLQVFRDENLKHCVVLPSSFFECDDVLECFDERFTVFCRERKSYNYCISKNHKAKFILSDDMAFSLNLDLQQQYDLERLQKNLDNLKGKDFSVLVNELYPQAEHLYQNIRDALIANTVLNADKVRIGFLLRSDAEKSCEHSELPKIDLSVFANSPCTDSGVVGILSNAFIAAINSFDVVVTDRLHVGLVASLLNKEVYLIDNSYKKVSEIFSYSMKNFPLTKLISGVQDIEIDKLLTQKSLADTAILSESISVEKFLKMYLSKATHVQDIKNTIWSVK